MPTVGMLYNTDTVTGRVQEFDNKNVGTGKTLAVSAYIVNDGNGWRQLRRLHSGEHDGRDHAKGLTSPASPPTTSRSMATPRRH